MDAQFWLIGLSNTIHLVSTVIWIGWSVLLALVVAPRAIEAHGLDEKWVTLVARRLPALAYGAMGALWATGMLQMGANPNYEGMFSFANLWSGLLVAKHLLILGSLAVILYLGQSVSPRLRLAVRRDALGKESNVAYLASRFRLLARLNFLAGLGVLVLTGLMTAIR